MCQKFIHTVFLCKTKEEEEEEEEEKGFGKPKIACETNMYAKLHRLISVGERDPQRRSGLIIFPQSYIQEINRVAIVKESISS